MKSVRSPMERMQALLDNRELDIKDLEKQLKALHSRLEVPEARNKDLKELVGRQASELVAKDRMILLLRQQIQT